MGRPPAARLRAAGLDLLKRLATAREFLLDHLDGRRPYERFRMLIPRGQKLHNGLLQFFDVGERSAADAFAGQFPEPSLDEIEPTGTRRDKMRNKARMSCEPGADLGMFVCTVVIQHQVQGHCAGKLVIQLAQKLQEFLMPMAFVALADYPSFQDLQGANSVVVPFRL